MSAMSAPGSGKPTLRIRGTTVSGPAAEPPRPAPAPGGRDHLAAGARAGGVRVPALDRADPRLAADVRGARDGDRVPAPARDPLAGERAPDRKRRRLHPPRARDGARRLVEHERLVDLRRHGRRLAALEAPDPVPRRSHLQPLELRARPLLPAARPGARRPARVLVGADGALARARARDHHRRRLRDPAAAAAAAHRRHLLGHLRREHRRARGERPRHDRALASRAGLGLVLLARSRVLARDPRLPLLHDHRPEDDPGRQGRAPGLRGLDRPARGAAARAADDRVRLQGGRPLLAGDRLRGAAAAGAARRGRPQAGLGRPVRRARREPRRRCGGARRRRRLRRPPGRRREPGALERGGAGAAGARRASSSRSRSSRRRGSRRSTSERPSGSRRTPSPISRTSRRRCAAATASVRPPAPTARGSRRCGGRSTARPGGRSSSRTTASSGCASASSPRRARRRRRSWRGSAGRSSPSRTRATARRPRTAARRRASRARSSSCSRTAGT